jgi:hypothetical protein
MTSIDICMFMGANGCPCCGDYTKWQPCNEDVPNHIPKEQVKKWLLTKRDNENIK